MIDTNKLKDYSNLKHTENLIIFSDVKSAIKSIRVKLEDELFKTDEYLNNILEKDITKVTNTDILDIIYNLYYLKGEFFNHPFVIHEYHISIRGLTYRPTASPSLKVNKEKFYYNKKVVAEGFDENYIDADDIIGWEYKDFDSTPSERFSDIRSILNLYKFSLLNDKLYQSARSYFGTWDYKGEDFWNNMIKYLLKTENYKALKGMNFDYSEITEENKNLVKSVLAINKFKL